MTYKSLPARILSFAESIPQTQQMQEGWLLVDLDATGITDIERYDEDPSQRFVNDWEAWKFVGYKYLESLYTEYDGCHTQPINIPRLLG